MFSKLLLNEGSAFNTTSGEFTCTTSGLYLFAWTFYVNPNTYCHTALTVNGHQNLITFADHRGITGASQSSTNVGIVRLNVGDSVWISVNRPSSCVMYSNSGMQRTFTGVLLHP